MKIKSKIDVITNSSSEVFIFKSNLKKNKIIADLHELTKHTVNYSGMGGILEFKDPVWLPQDSLMLEIDQGYNLEEIKKYISSIGVIECKNPEELINEFYNKKIEKLYSKISRCKSNKDMIKLFEQIENLTEERDNEDL